MKTMGEERAMSDRIVDCMTMAWSPPDPVDTHRAALMRGAVRLAKEEAPELVGFIEALRDQAERELEQHLAHLRRVDEANGAYVGYRAEYAAKLPLDSDFTAAELRERWEEEREREEAELEASCDVHGIVRIDRRDQTWYLPSEHELECMCRTGDPESDALDRAALLDAMELTLTWNGVHDGGYTGRVLEDIREHLASYLPEEDRKALDTPGARVMWTDGDGNEVGIQCGPDTLWGPGDVEEAAD